MVFNPPKFGAQNFLFAAQNSTKLAQNYDVLFFSKFESGGLSFLQPPQFEMVFNPLNFGAQNFLFAAQNSTKLAQNYDVLFFSKFESGGLPHLRPPP